MTTQEQTISVEWDFIVSAIEEQKAILFIGEELTFGYSNKPEAIQIISQLVERRKNYISSFHEKDGFLVFNETGKKNKAIFLSDLKKMYAQTQEELTNPVLEKIADIPFPLIISVTPDLLLGKIFKGKSYAFQHDYYKAQKPPKSSLDKAISKAPLLYQILGSIEDDESLIISQEDLFKLTESVYKDGNLPEILTTVFNEAKCILFLGFDFEKWYFQMLLHLLKMNFNLPIYASHSPDKILDWQTFYEAQFGLTFVSHDIDKFVEELYQKFTPEQLRKPAENSQQLKRVYKKDKVLKMLSKSFNAQDFETFCYLNFEEVKEQFTPEMGQTKRLTLLLEHTEKYEKWEELLTLAKEENPPQYKNFEPYYEEVE